MQKPTVIIVAGPTASGKTTLGIELAKQIDGEIISCDSMQIYQDMNIGTAKPSKEEMQGILHHMIDVVSPIERFSVSQFKNMASQKIEEVLAKGKVPILVGGTGLYINALLYNITYYDTKIEEVYRRKLEEQVKVEGLEKLYLLAKKIDPVAMEKISPNDQKRILRVLEIYHQTKKTKTELEELSRKEEVPYQYVLFVLDFPREELYDRINQRVDKMIQEGLIEEVEKLITEYGAFPTAMQGLGYKEVKQYLEGTITKEEMVEILKQETRRYSKRQITWFRKNAGAIWLDAKQETEELIKKIKGESGLGKS